MSSSSSTTGLGRTRSLRQPTAGLGSISKSSETKRSSELTNKSAATSPSLSSSATEPSRLGSPSRLPKPGLSTSAAGTAAGTSVTAGSAAQTSVVGGKSRPTSGLFGLGRSNSAAVRQASIKVSGEGGGNNRPKSGIYGLSRSKTTAAQQPSNHNLAEEGTDRAKTTRTLPTTRSRLTRPKSMIGPPQPSPTSAALRPSSGASTGPGLQSPRIPAHARAKSTATALTSTTTLRPPRPPSAESATSSSTTATAASKRLLSRPPKTVATQAPKQRQVSASSAADTSVLSATSSATTNARPLKQAAADEPPRLRPAFNTLQQHYSPARNLAPKPSTASYLAPPTPSKLPANVALSTETAKLQTELLQLHLLHRDADAVTASWHVSAKKRLGRRFEQLARVDDAVANEEAAVAETQNLAALHAWAGQGNGRSLDNQVQTLDGVLSGLWSLSEPGGRYARVLRRFEKWVDQMMAAVEARRKAGGLGALMDSGEVAFIPELEPTWKDEVSSLTRKLDSWRVHLGQLEEGLPDATGDGEQPKSSLVRILAGCRCQVYDMLAELDIMEQVERDAFSQEAAWIRRMNREDAADDTPGAGAIWRAF